MNDLGSGGDRRGFVRRVTGLLAAIPVGATLSGLRPEHVQATESQIDLGRAGADPFIGEMIAVPYNFAPRGFAFCEGQEMQVQQNQALFSLIGNFYGGDGRTTFNLPDTRPLEAAAKKQARVQRPPFRYVIALTGTFPSRA